MGMGVVPAPPKKCQNIFRYFDSFRAAGVFRPLVGGSQERCDLRSAIWSTKVGSCCDDRWNKQTQSGLDC